MKKLLVLIMLCLFVVGCADKYYDSEEDFSEIDYNIPNEFEVDDDNSFSKYYNCDENDVYSYVSIHSYKKSLYKDKEKWFKGCFTITLNDKVSDIEEIEINGSKVLFLKIESENSIYYCYGFESSNYYYSLTYSIYDYESGDRADIDTNKCYISRDAIVNSVTLK